MAPDFTNNVIRRSRLIMPANERRFVEKAYLRNADAVVLDLEDSVPASEKLSARQLLKELVPIAGKGGSDVFVRVNHTQELLSGDIEAAIWPGLAGIYLPKVETGEQIRAVGQMIANIEKQRGIPAGQIKISIIIETVKGYLNTEAIAAASDRVDALTLGTEDFSLDTGIEICEETAMGLLIPRLNVLFAARAYGKLPLGLMGSIAAFSNTAGFERNARLSYKYGFLGASCIHPDNVETLNACFSPAKEELEYSVTIINAMEAGLARGRASVAVDGKMIDYAHYEKARKMLARNAKIKEIEKKKKKARDAFLGGGLSQ